MDQPIVSVIVPVYNAISTLTACVKSIREQTLNSLEILLIDDGSKDDSYSLCNSLSKEDKRIRVFHKENGGQSSARNIGLDNAQGEYIAFIDSDDTIDSDMLLMLYKNAIDTDSQLSVCGFRLLKNGVDISPKKHQEERVVFTRLEAVSQMLDERYLLFSVCDKLYHHSLLEKLRFEVGVIHEDVLFPYEALLLCNNAVCEMKPKYNYLLNTDSTTGKAFSPARLYDITAREKLADDICKRFPKLAEQTKNIVLVGYLNLINKLVFEGGEVKGKYLSPLLRYVRKNAGGFLSCQYINKKKKLGVMLICIGSPIYKLALTAMGGGNA